MVFQLYAPAIKIAVVRMSLEGQSQNSICHSLGYSISRQSFKRWMDLFEHTKCVVRDPETYATRGQIATLTAEETDFIIELVRSEPGLFLSKMRERLYNSSGTLLSTQAIHHNLVNRLCITLKKAETSNVRKSLVAKYSFIEQMQLFPADWLVFTDESSFCDRDLLRTFTRSPQGLLAARHITNQNSERISLMPAISIGGVLALTTTMDTFKGAKFEKILEFDLVPCMSPYPGKNSVLVLDNAAIHRGKRVKEICRAARIHIMYLPPYCPELNPIELGFAAVKIKLRSTQELSRTLDPRWIIRQETVETMTKDFCYSVYQNCGYCVD